MTDEEIIEAFLRAGTAPMSYPTGGFMADLYTFASRPIKPYEVKTVPVGTVENDECSS